MRVAVGDGESAWDIRNGFGRKKEEEMVFLLSYTKAKAENAQVRNGLGHRNVAHTPDIFSTIPTVRLCTIVL